MNANPNPILAHADAAAVEVDRSIAAIWPKLLKVISIRSGYQQDYHRALDVLVSIPRTILRSLSDAYANLYRIGRLSGRATIAKDLRTHGHLPSLRRAIARRLLAVVGGLTPRAIHLAAASHSPAVARFTAEGHDTVGGAGRVVQLTEADTDDVWPGFVQITPQGIEENPSLIDYLLAHFGNGGNADELDFTGISQPRGIELADLLIGPPSQSQIWAAIAPLTRPHDWQAIGDLDKKMPHELAAEIAGGLAQGESQREVANRILPYLEGSRVRRADSPGPWGCTWGTRRSLPAGKSCRRRLIRSTASTTAT